MSFLGVPRIRASVQQSIRGGEDAMETIHDENMNNVNTVATFKCSISGNVCLLSCMCLCVIFWICMI